MTEKQKEIVKELESLVMDLHRSAGQLDTVIQDIKSDALEELGEYGMGYLLRCRRTYREDHLKVFGDLNEKEYQIWSKLD